MRLTYVCGMIVGALGIFCSMGIIPTIPEENIDRFTLMALFWILVVLSAWAFETSSRTKLKSPEKDGA